MKSNFTLIVSLIFSLAVVSCSSSRTDAEIQQIVNDSLKANQSTMNVNAVVTNGAVTLTGACEGEDCAAQTEDKIRNLDGVKSVTNNVTMAQQNTDYTLRTQVQNIVTKYAGVQADVANGVVVLRGSVERSQLQSLMSELNSTQAKKIDNQLAVK